MLKRLMLYLADKAIELFPGYFLPLKEEILKSGEEEIFEVYIGKMIVLSMAGLVVVGSLMFFVFRYGGFDLVTSAISASILGLITFFLTLTVFHSLPFQAIGDKATSIEANLPFAVNHMSAVASAGVSPYVMFKLVSDIKEYGEVSKQFRKIVRNVDTFGMDITAAITDVANRSPSESMQKILHSIVSTIQGGGDLASYLKNAAEQQMFEYKLRRKKYISLLQTYADIYTILLVAAPMMLIAFMIIISMITTSGTFGGIRIDILMGISVYALIPLINMAFLAFLQMTQPEI